MIFNISNLGAEKSAESQNKDVELMINGKPKKWSEILDESTKENMNRLVSKMVKADRCPAFIRRNLLKLKEEPDNVALFHWILLYAISIIPEVKVTTDGETISVESENAILAASLELMAICLVENPQYLMFLVEEILRKERIAKEQKEQNRRF